MIDLINSVFGKFWLKFIDYLPDFFGGLIILILGFIIANIVRRLLKTLFAFFRVDNLLQKTKVIAKDDVMLWEEILAEIARWTIIILFLVPALEAWRLSRATQIINQVLFYIPNVIIAVIIGFVGLIVANLIANLVRHSTKSIGETSANTLAVFARSAIIFFTALIILNQVGVAQDLVRIIFTGIVVMLALAGGLAFGLGGKDLAQDLLERLRKKLE